jgi:hypothetical protein
MTTFFGVFSRRTARRRRAKPASAANVKTFGFERSRDTARMVVVHARDEARELKHNYSGNE